MRITLTTLFLAIFTFAQAQKLKPLNPESNPDIDPISCKTTNSNIIDGEKITYVLSYTWFFIWTDVGEAEFSVTNERKFGRNLLHLRAYGKSYPFYDYFFKVRDLYETWVEPETLEPVYFNRDINEGGYKKENEYWFDWQKRELKVRVRRREGANRYDTLEINRCCHDVVTAIYIARTLDFKDVYPGKTYTVSVVMDEEIYDVGYRFVKREVKDLPELGKVNCLKFQCDVIAGDVFTEEQKIYVWATDDGNKLPVYAESPIRVGTVKARVSKISGQKYPLNVIPKKKK